MRKKEKGEREIKAPKDEVSYFIERKQKEEIERETKRPYSTTYLLNSEHGNVKMAPAN